jgi:hypothetical protein
VTRPTSHKFFKAAKYFSCLPWSSLVKERRKDRKKEETSMPLAVNEPPSGRSNHLRQNAKVPKVLVMCWSNFWREDDERRDPKEGIPSSEGGEVEHEEHGNLSCNESIPDPVIIVGVRRGREGGKRITSTTNPRPVDPKVSMAYISPSSMRVASPPDKLHEREGNLPDLCRLEHSSLHGFGTAQ